jgi:hypothetical protein
MKTLYPLPRIWLVILLFPFVSIAQPVDLDWAQTKGSGATALDAIFAITTDDDGNVYSAGSFGGTVDFDFGSGVNSLTSQQHRDGFLCKEDSNGALLWVKQLKGVNNQKITDIKLDDSGNIYAIGDFNGITDFDPGTGTQMMDPADGGFFIWKLDANGDFVWTKQTKATLRGMDINSVGSQIVLVGYFSGSQPVDFDPGTGNYFLQANNFDGFILSLSASGNFQWAKQIGSTQYDNCEAIAIDVNDDILICGRFADSVDFDLGSATFYLDGGSSTAYVAKYEANGDLNWAKAFHPTSTQQVYGSRSLDLITDYTGNVHILGSFADSVDFDPGTSAFYLDGSAYEGDPYATSLVKLDSLGNFNWVKAYGQSNIESLDIDPFGNIYSFGSSSLDTIDIDPGINTHYVYGSNSFIQKLDAYGNLLWAGAFDGSNVQRGWSIHLDHTQNIYAGGEFRLDIDVDPGSGVDMRFNSGGINSGEDMFMVKLDQCFENLVLSKEECEGYEWPITGQTYTSSGNYFGIVSNEGQCDTVYELDLTIIPNTYATVVDSGCGDYFWSVSEETYVESGTYVHTLTNQAGCDSVVSLQLVLSPPLVSTFSMAGDTLTADAANLNYQWILCSNGATPINGANSQSYVITASGEYALVVSQNGCTDTSACQLIWITGVSALASQNIRVFPNPTEGSLNVSLDAQLELDEIVVRNLSGQVISQHEVSSDQFVLQLNQAAGFYIVEFYHGQQLIDRRQIVKSTR